MKKPLRCEVAGVKTYETELEDLACRAPTLHGHFNVAHSTAYLALVMENKKATHLW